MKNRRLPALMFVIPAVLLPAATLLAQSDPPAPPPSPILETYSFLETNWDSDSGYAPIGMTNVATVATWLGDAPMLDNTNQQPAFLHYKIVESDGHTNINLADGAAICMFICNWASADGNQNGQGPGELGYLLAAGDWSTGSPEGLWRIYVDAGGTNLYFGGVSNSVATTYLSTPISWSSNSFHFIGVYYGTTSALYLDGQLVATGGPVTVVPATNTWTNGFFVGSDGLGYEQSRGVFWYLEFDTTNIAIEGANYFTSYWPYLYSGYNDWLNPSGGGNNGMFSPGLLHPLSPSNNYITGNAVYITNLSSSVVPGQGVTFTFSIEGGSNGVAYDVFSTTNLVGPKLTNSVWTWLGQGTNGGMYQITDQTSAQSFFVLGTPLPAPDKSGATVAYEALVPSWHNTEIYISKDFVVAIGTPITSSGTANACPGPYTGYITYVLPAPVWGWPPSTDTTVYTASDTNRTDTKVEYVGSYGDEGCNQTTVTIPYPPVSPLYRFAIYFTNNVPTTTNYPITLSGFNP